LVVYGDIFKEKEMITLAIKIFAELLKYPFVIIYDNATGNKLHKTTCSFITKKNFDKKVIFNGKKNGRYVSLGSLNLITDSTVQPCKVCKPYIY
jgi:hypothetical protein